MNEFEKERQRKYSREYYWRHKNKIAERIKTKYRPAAKKRAAERRVKEERLLNELIETYDNLVVELLKLLRTVRR